MAAAALTATDCQLTAEQRAIVYDSTHPPGTQPVPPAVRVTAGAGTGKTTVLEKVVGRLGDLGHTRGQYVAFGKTAAQDATARMTRGGLLPLDGGLDSSTADSCARKCLREAVDLVHEPMEDTEFKAKVLDLCLDDIRTNITGSAEGLSPRKMRRLERLVGNFICQTVERCFMHSSLAPEEAFDPARFNSVYYPATLWHDRKSSNHKEDAPAGVPTLTAEVKSFYVTQARKIWTMLDDPENALSTHSSVMKQAQLKQLRIPGTFLLVDEVQDLNPCQLDWFIQQHKQGMHVFFVGDMAQQIYSFRGAKSGPLLDYQDAQDLKLTVSFRFGRNIATIANTILFAKLMSEQTSVEDAVANWGLDWKGFRRPTRARLWRPYSLSGQSPDAGQVGWQLSEPSCSLMDGPEQVTLLAAKNHTLMAVALPRVLASVAHGSPIKVAVNGRGHGSGLGKWQDILKEVGHFARLWDLSGPNVPLECKQGTTLPFREFEKETELTWDGVLEVVRQEELKHFDAVIAIVCVHQEATMGAMASFKEHVLDRRYTQEEADLVLSTIHSAKGMEWDNVELCDDLCALSTIKVVECTPEGLPEKAVVSFRAASCPRHGHNLRAMFGFKDHGDDINMWYVAVTRAKRRLSLPLQFKQLTDDCRYIRRFADGAAVSPRFARFAGSSPSASQPDEFPDSPGPSIDDVIKVQGQVFDRENAKLIKRSLYFPLLQEGHGSWTSGDWTWQQPAGAAYAATAATVATVAGAGMGIRVKRELQPVATVANKEDEGADVSVTGVVTAEDRTKRARQEAEDLTE